MKVALFIGITIVFTFIIFIYTVIGGETWDGYCGYKMEWGLIPFLRTGAGSGPIEECKNGLIYPGIYFYLLALFSYGTVLTLAWKKLIS